MGRLTARTSSKTGPKATKLKGLRWSDPRAAGRRSIVSRIRSRIIVSIVSGPNRTASAVGAIATVVSSSGSRRQAGACSCWDQLRRMMTPSLFHHNADTTSLIEMVPEGAYATVPPPWFPVMVDRTIVARQP